MPSLGTTSLKRLSTCDTRLQNILKEAIKIIDFTVLYGHRTEEEQNDAFAKGNSQLKYPNSSHNISPSKAVDIAPYPIDWNDRERFIYLAGIVLGLAKASNVNLVWGGDWDMDGNIKEHKFQDLVHFEIKD